MADVPLLEFKSTISWASKTNCRCWNKLSITVFVIIAMVMYYQHNDCKILFATFVFYCYY